MIRPRVGEFRSGFSLLEVIIATAILAASAMVLLSLLGLGTKFGNRAEERSLAASQAQSLLDEFVSMPSPGSNASAAGEQEERTGVLPGRPRHSYRLRAVRYEPADSRADGPSNLSPDNADNSLLDSGRSARGLTLVTVQVFGSTEPATNETPLIELKQMVRSSWLTTAGSSPQVAPKRDPFQFTD